MVDLPPGTPEEPEQHVWRPSCMPKRLIDLWERADKIGRTMIGRRLQEGMLAIAYGDESTPLCVRRLERQDALVSRLDGTPFLIPSGPVPALWVPRCCLHPIDDTPPGQATESESDEWERG